jgi:SAM-dependent methyltransferase
MFSTLAVCYFPYATDDWKPQQQDPVKYEEAQDFYKGVYAESELVPEADASDGHGYAELGRLANEEQRIPAMVADFVAEHGLEDAKTLEVGAGAGQLQDLVEDYTGLDIAPSAARYFHKPFVAASATDLPFEDSSFGALWTVWTLEHIPNPERALEEMRRVVEDGGYMLIAPAWICPPWAAEGYAVRPYSDLDWSGKLVKSSLIVRDQSILVSLGLMSARVVRRTLWGVTGGPTRLRFWRLDPNYEKYWVPDADAAVSIDRHEVMLWFESRGDECLNCGADAGAKVTEGFGPLKVRVRKRPQRLPWK